MLLNEHMLLRPGCEDGLILIVPILIFVMMDESFSAVIEFGMTK